MEEYRFRKLIVWQWAMALAREVHKVTGQLKGRDRVELADQMCRAAISIPSNIAEGNGRYYRAEYLRFLSIASGSLAELETQLELTAQLGLLPPSSLAPAQDLQSETSRLLVRLIRALRQPDASAPSSR